MGNGIDMREMAFLCGKRVKYVRNDSDMWEMAKIFGKSLMYA